MTIAPEQLGNYLEIFDNLQKHSAAHDPGWLRSLREDALVRFNEAGFPTTRDEDWRFTNVSVLAQIPFRMAASEHPAVSARQIELYDMAGSVCQMVFINGRFAPQLSRLNNLPAGLEVCSLAEAVARDEEGVKLHLGRHANTRRDAFVALNAALWEDGAYIHIRKSALIEQPVHLLYLSVGEDEAIMTHPRTLIVAEAGSEATVVEDCVSLGDDVAFSNAVTELVAGDGAVVSHCMIERENDRSFNISTLRTQQGRAANVASHSILLGGSLVRNNVHPVLAGEGAECLINGLFIGAGHQHLDNYMLVEHASPNGSSRQFYNGILDGQAHGVFHGRIIVHKDAQKTDAKQTNRNLLLSDDARIDTKPQLEIHADDVKCTHGATIGQIDENALFYLRSRGLDEVHARKALLEAFAGECVGRIQQSAVRSFVENLLQDRLIGIAHATPGAPLEATGDETRQHWEEVG
jgi:Fe-S cluster assembly protein SufD